MKVRSVRNTYRKQLCISRENKQLIETVTMRKHASMLAAALLLLALPAVAQNVGNITISGTVAPIQQITVTSQSGYNALDLANGETDKLVAIVNERSNDQIGYKVTLRSANAFAASGAQAYLKGAASGNPDGVNYSIKYNGSAVTLSTGEAIVTSASARTTGSGVNKNLQVTLSGAFNVADTYSDTLTLTLLNN